MKLLASLHLPFVSSFPSLSSARFRLILHIYRLAPRTFPLIRNGVRRETEKPGCKRGARPCITFQVRERLVKNLRSQIFRFIAIAHSPRDERINTAKVNFVQISKLRGILLRSLYQQTLPGVFADQIRRRSSRRHLPSAYL